MPLPHFPGNDESGLVPAHRVILRLVVVDRCNHHDGAVRHAPRGMSCQNQDIAPDESAIHRQMRSAESISPPTPGRSARRCSFFFRYSTDTSPKQQRTLEIYIGRSARWFSFFFRYMEETEVLNHKGLQILRSGRHCSFCGPGFAM